MGKMGCGYGSEFHLLRYLGYHRQKLNHAIEEKTGGRVLDWLDFGIAGNANRHYLDLEFRGLDFLGADHPARVAWNDFWPQTGNVHNWDAVGLLQSASQVEYLLVEAKSHVEELENHRGAKKEGGLAQIGSALEETIKACCIDEPVEKWLTPYYQYANRLAALQFLAKNGVPAQLIFVYFLGNQWPRDADSKGRPVTCPKTEEEWKSHLQPMYVHLGLKQKSELENRLHPLFLPVGGP